MPAHAPEPGARRVARPRGRSLGGTCGGGRSGGRDRRPRPPRGAGALSASGAGLRAGEGGDAVSPRPKGAEALGIQQALSCWLDLQKVVCKTGHLGFLYPLLEPRVAV